jgi:hypothetical protein
MASTVTSHGSKYGDEELKLLVGEPSGFPDLNPIDDLVAKTKWPVLKVESQQLMMSSRQSQRPGTP